jgi:hypothetical protein
VIPRHEESLQNYDAVYGDPSCVRMTRLCELVCGISIVELVYGIKYKNYFPQFLSTILSFRGKRNLRIIQRCSCGDPSCVRMTRLCELVCGISVVELVYGIKYNNYSPQFLSSILSFRSTRNLYKTMMLLLWRSFLCQDDKIVELVCVISVVELV